MVIYTTLKKNKEHEIDYWDIIVYYEECFGVLADLFENSQKYYEGGYDDCTDLDKLMEDYSERQIASAVLKQMRKMAKSKDAILLNLTNLKVFLEIDCDGEIAFDQLEQLIGAGEITGSNQLRDIGLKAKKKGVTIKKGYRYGENDIYFGYHYIDYLIDKYFPCKEKRMVDEEGFEYYECVNCHNCQ